MGQLKIKTKWWVLLFLAGILSLAFFLRTQNLLSIPIFADEAIYIRWAQVMRAESGLRFLPLSDGKQPLFMWLVIPFLKVFSDPLIAGRVVSALSGLGGIVGIFLLTDRLLKSKKAGLIASFFYTVSPFFVFFDRMALVDSLLASLAVWILYFGVLTAQTQRLDFAMITGFFLGFALLTKSPAVFFLLLLPTTVLVSQLNKKKWVGWVSLLGLWTVAAIIAFGMYNILRLGPNFHMIALRNKDYVFGLNEVLKHPFDPFQFHIRELLDWFWQFTPNLVLIAAFLGVVTERKKFKREVLLLGIWMLVPLMIQSEIAKVFTVRYILYTAFPVFIFAAMFFEKISGFVRNRYLIALVIVFCVPALLIDNLLINKPEDAPLPRVERSGYLELWTSGTGIREVADIIKAEHVKNPTVTIVVGTEGFFGTLPDGLQIYFNNVPNVIIKGVGISIADVNESLIEAKKANDKVYLVVNSSRLTEKPENIGIKLLASYPKAMQPSGVRENLLLFEVLDQSVEIFNLKNAENNQRN